MASSVAMSVAQQHLPELLNRVERGEEILIERDGHADAKLIPVAAESKTKAWRVSGQNLSGTTYIAPDCFNPMTEDELKKWGIDP